MLNPSSVMNKMTPSSDAAHGKAVKLQCLLRIMRKWDTLLTSLLIHKGIESYVEAKLLCHRKENEKLPT